MASNCPLIAVDCTFQMAVTLTKIVDGKPTASNEFASWLEVRCPRCEQVYRLRYSDEDGSNLRTWQQLAEEALWKDHGLRHQAATIPLECPAIRSGYDVAQWLLNGPE